MVSNPHLRGHLLQFARRSALAHPSSAGGRFLIAALIVEILRLAALRWLHPGIPLWLLLPALLGLALLVVRGLESEALSGIGLRPWGEWSLTERSYFLQVVVLAFIVFPLVLGSPLAVRDGQPDAIGRLWRVFVPYLCFGFYQELIYRGLVQRELVRRWGAVAGIVVANLLYTLGPLHWSYFASRAAVAVPMFASIFLIGLFFGALYHRSGNLWIVATFHAIGNAYILSSVGPAV